MFASCVYTPGYNFSCRWSWHLTSSVFNWKRQSFLKIKMLKYPHALQKLLAQTLFLHYSWIRKNKAVHYGSPRNCLSTHPTTQPRGTLPSSRHLSLSRSLPEQCICRTTRNLQSLKCFQNSERFHSVFFKLCFLSSTRVYVNRNKHIKAISSEALP